MNCLRGLIVLFCILFATVLKAQMPSDLSNLKASQISNTQLQQYMAQAKERGLTLEQTETELLRRGFPETEMAELRVRIQQLASDDNSTDEVNPQNQNQNQDTK